jgi:hypothetical protein
MNATPTHSTFAGARLLEPIEHRQHIEFIERRVAGKRLVREFAENSPCPPSSAPTVLPSTIDTPPPTLFDDTANARATSGFRCLYCVLIFPTDAKLKKHVKKLRQKEAKLGAKLRVHETQSCPCAYCDLDFPTNSERKTHVKEVHENEESKPRPKTSLVKDSPVRLPWGWQKIKAEGCYTEAISRTWVPLTTGLVEPVVSSCLSITTYAPTPQPPPQPPQNSELYEPTPMTVDQLTKVVNKGTNGFGTEYFVCDSPIPMIPKRSLATTERGINAFRERRDSLLLQRKMLYAAGEQLLKDHLKEGKELAKTQGVPYIGFKNDYIDKRTRCKECGGTFFLPSKSKLRCRDCGWSFAEKRARKAASDKVNTLGNDFHLEGSWVKETTKAPVRSQDDLLPNLRMKYNPWNKARSEAGPYVLNHPDFLKDVNVLETKKTSPKEAAARRGMEYDTFRQQTSRARRALLEYDPKTAMCKFLGKKPVPAGFNVGVTLNGVTEIKYLGALSDSNEAYLKALEKLKKATIANSLKSLRKKARLNGWSKKMLEAERASAHSRIEGAYRIPFEGISNTEKAEGTLSQIFT